MDDRISQKYVESYVHATVSHCIHIQYMRNKSGALNTNFCLGINKLSDQKKIETCMKNAIQNMYFVA